MEWRELSRGGGDGVGWHGSDVVVVTVVWWRVEERVRESEYGERVDRAKRNTFGFGQNARRKTFPAAATWWWPECWPEKITGDGGNWVVAGDGRRKTFSAVAAGGEGWPAVGEGGERERVYIC
ncbi:hypothetical protein Tco_1231374, partial [Tanacetum coccineum]